MEVLKVKFGSHLYGTNTEKSDTDYKGIYIPDAKEICLGTYKKVISFSKEKGECERNTKDDIDYEIFSLDRFVYDIASGQTWALDLLFAGEDMYVDSSEKFVEIMRHLRKWRLELLSSNILSFIGYANKQAAKYGIKGTRMDSVKKTLDLLKTFPLHSKLIDHAPYLYRLADQMKDVVSLENTPLIQVVEILGADKKTMYPHLDVCGRKIAFNCTVKLAIECYQKIYDEYGKRSYVAHLNGGRDWKALSHAVRVCTQGKELLETGSVTFPLANRKLLIDIKDGLVEFDKVSEMIESGLVDLKKAQTMSVLRPSANYEWIDDFIYEAYKESVCEASN